MKCVVRGIDASGEALQSWGCYASDLNEVLKQHRRRVLLAVLVKIEVVVQP